jgi:hypothetical protein
MAAELPGEVRSAERPGAAVPTCVVLVPASSAYAWARRNSLAHNRLPRGIHAVAAVAMLLLRARQRCSWMTIVTPYTPTMTAGMTTNR